MLSFLVLGFLIGLRHALEPDHVAAVVSLSTRGGTLRDQARNGALWGVGHALTLLLLAGSCVVFGVVIPERTGLLLEGAVGVMLIWLGVAVFARIVLSAGAAHEHAHERRSRRTLLVGAVHGTAGSSALVLLVGRGAQTPALGLAYVVCFGLGAIAGMMLLASAITLPFGLSAGRRAGLYRWLCAGAGAVSIALGGQLVWALAAAGGA